ncbi:uncharacterized protein LOC120336028 isoform X2 [Styela clava]
MATNLIIKSMIYLLLMGILLTPTYAGCSTVFNGTKKTYIGWPVVISCSEAYSMYYEAFYYDFDDDEFDLTCIIQIPELNKTLLNETTSAYDISTLEYDLQVNESTPTEIEITVQLSSENCVTEKLQLTTSKLSNYDCNSVPKDKTNVVERKRIQEATTIMYCELTSQSEEPAINVRNYEVTWYHNCDTNLPPNVTVTNDQLTIPVTDYRYHPGEYSCSVIDNNQTRYIVFYELCIEPRQWSPIVQVSAPEESKYRVGETINITCDVNIGSGTFDSTAYSMNFNRLLPNGSIDESKDNISCTANLGGGRETSPDERVTCVFLYGRNASADPFKCFAEIPTQEEWEAEKNKTLKTLHMIYEMKDIQKQDFGRFQAFVKNEISQINDTDITIVTEIVNNPEKTIQIIWIVIGSVLGVVFIVVLCAILWLEIQWTWKHYFASSDEDVRNFGAYFAYFWTNDTQPNPAYDALIENIKIELGKLNSPIYDPHHNPAKFEWNIENINRVQQMCDRIIIILTENYLEDPENTFEIYNNFLQSSFIFIKTPGIDQVIQNLEDERRHGIKAALRRNFVIDWSGEELSQRFKRRLELAMPKRRPAENRNGAVIYENDAVVFHQNGNGSAL